MSHCTWEKEVNAFRNGVQDAPDTDEYIRENLPRLLSKAIASAVEAREREIRVILEQRLLIKCECEDGDCQNCRRLLKVLGDISIINPSKE